MWKSIIEKTDSSKPGYSSVFLKRESNYYTALCFLKLNRIIEAEPYVEKALEITQKIDTENDDAYTSYIYLISGMLNDVKGNKSTAVNFYDKVLSMKNYQNSHQEAERFKKDGYKQF
ncbi:MAG: tetratricopeptide repeat protein [Ignavibacteria bacterium]|nr:tetratricopeptide repeat protein [Ignavibacteria bacterium]